MHLTGSLSLPRCPHCSIANPLLNQFWQPQVAKRTDGRTPHLWSAFSCTSCGSVVTTRCRSDNVAGRHEILAIYPTPRTVDEDLPEIAKRFLQQAQDTLHAPDAAAVMAGSSVDAMLKHLGFEDGSVYVRIEKAVEANVLTKGMGEWAHSVRLGSNRPRHADAERPHVSSDEAAQSVEFATALGQFLFVLTAKVQRGIEKAKEAEQAG